MLRRYLGLVNMKKFNLWLCKTFGHRFDSVDLLVFQIMSSAINSKELSPTITCQRCGKIFRIDSVEE